MTFANDISVIVIRVRSRQVIGQSTNLVDTNDTFTKTVWIKIKRSMNYRCLLLKDFVVCSERFDFETSLFVS